LQPFFFMIVPSNITLSRLNSVLPLLSS